MDVYYEPTSGLRQAGKRMASTIVLRVVPAPTPTPVPAPSPSPSPSPLGVRGRPRPLLMEARVKELRLQKHGMLRRDAPHHFPPGQC